MNFDDILNHFDPNNSKNSYRDLSFFLEKLLEHHFEKQKIRYHQLSAPFFPFDYIIEDTFIPDLPTPTAVEIKIIPSALAVGKILDKFLNQKEKFHPEPKSLIVISTLSKNDIGRLFKNKEFNFPYKICGKEFISELIIENIDFSKNLLTNLYNIKFEEIFSNKNNDQNWEDERSKRIEQLKLKYKDGNFSLLLGAGVSCVMCAEKTGGFNLVN